LDIRRHIVKLECEPFEELVILKMHLGVGSEGYARPEEILIYGFGLSEREVLSLLFKRTGLFIAKDKLIQTPMKVV
jgi:hypothetical protein